MHPFTDQLRALRITAGLTLREVSARTSLSPSALSDIERGRRRPSLEALEQLLEVYQMRLAIVPAQRPTAAALLQRLRVGQLTAVEQEHLAALLDHSLPTLALFAGLVDERSGSLYAQLRQLHAAVARHQTALTVLFESELTVMATTGMEPGDGVGLS